MFFFFFRNRLNWTKEKGSRLHTSKCHMSFYRRSIFVCVCTSEMKCFCLSVCAWDHTCFRWAHVHKVKFNLKNCIPLKMFYFDHPVTWVTHWDVFCQIKYCLTVLVCSTVNTNMFEGFQSVQSNLCVFCLMWFFLLSHSTSMTASEYPKWARVIKLLTEAFACKSICVDFLLKCIWDVQELSYLMALTAPLLEHS